MMTLRKTNKHKSRIPIPILLLFVLISLFFTNCKQDEMITPTPPPPDPEPPLVLVAEEGEEFSGGTASVRDISKNAFSFQVSGLADMDELFFFVGNSFFNQNWVAAPASTKARDGLGPFFNARSCASCHFKDGRGQAIEGDNQKGRGLLIRLSIPGTDEHGGPLPDAIYGGQLQDQAVLNIQKEGLFTLNYEEQPGNYPDGESYSLRKPIYHFSDLAYGNLHPEAQFSPRVAPQMIGLGLLEALEESTLLAHADEFDSDNDGISGRPNYVWDFVANERKIGRFGWKANQPTLLQQTAGAFAGDMGITSYVFPDDNCTGDLNCEEIPNGGIKEIDDDDLEKVVLYSSTLAVPTRRNWEDEEVLLGKHLFNKISCTSCHIPKMVTGEHPKFPTLSNQTIRPYTDLLLHDMGTALADYRPDFEADGQEWRTPPLWGIGLFKTVNGHTTYLHDGRARNIEEAILWHGGEAQKAQEGFKNLKKSDRNAIIKFLNTL
jgi:CxxC motif-containing protein (DUF1111 family)